METFEELAAAGGACGASGVMVEVELDLPKVLASGARWVSLSSAASQRRAARRFYMWMNALFVSFQDILCCG